MNAKAERLALKDVCRSLSWPPCIWQFWKGSPLENKVSDSSPSELTKQEQMWHKWPPLYAYLREKWQGLKQGSGSRPERRTIGVWASNGVVHVNLLFCAWVRIADRISYVCLLQEQIQYLKKSWHFSQLYVNTGTSEYLCYLIQPSLFIHYFWKVHISEE